MFRKYSLLKNIFVRFQQPSNPLSTGDVTKSLRPFYFLVHPDLFAQHPRAQHINDVNLKLLTAHLDYLINNIKPPPLKLSFYVRNLENGTLEIKSLTLNSNTPKLTLQTILRAFKLPTNFVDNLKDGPLNPTNLESNFCYGNPFVTRQYDIPKVDDLYSWLVKNMGEAEKRLSTSELIRNDIVRLQDEVINNLNIDGVSWQRGIGTIHLRGCFQGLKALSKSNPKIKSVLKGRHIHFGNVTGVSLNGSIILSTSEVRDQWLQMISTAENLDSKVKRIPFMKKAVSNSLRNINVTQRKYQTFVLADSYCDNLKRLVTSLGDFLGKSGFPPNWPVSLSHLQLVVESANGPLMLSPSGQIIAPSSCPPWLLVSFISENMDEAIQKISENESISEKEIEVFDRCKEEFSLAFLDKDDSVSPNLMVDCLLRLLDNSYRLTPLLAGARVWITQYYSVMLDGEVCIPHNWK